MFDAEFTDGNLGDNFQTQEMRRFPEGSKRGDGIQCFQLELFFTQSSLGFTFFMAKENES